jgi:hypothetical protein
MAEAPQQPARSLRRQLALLLAGSLGVVIALFTLVIPWVLDRQQPLLARGSLLVLAATLAVVLFVLVDRFVSRRVIVPLEGLLQRFRAAAAVNLDGATPAAAGGD